MKNPIEHKTYVYVTSPENRKHIEFMAEKSGFKKQEGYTGKGPYISFWGDRVFTDSEDVLRLSGFKQVFIDMPPVNLLVDNFIENTSETKNPIAPNTKIRILSPEHSEYVQKLAFDAGFKWFSGACEISNTDEYGLFFRNNMEITYVADKYLFDVVGELKEIFIDLPAELMTAEYVKNRSGYQQTDAEKDETIDESVRKTFEVAIEEGVKNAQIEKSVNRLQKKADKFAAMKQAQTPATSKHSHYFKDVSDLDEVDVYRVCDLFEVNDNSGAIQHALKKLLCSGQRGAKGYRKDLEEARDSIQRKLDLMAEDGE